MKEISSADNPAVKQLSALSQKKYRDKTGLYLIEGPNLLAEALKNGAGIERIFLRASRMERPDREYTELLRLACGGREAPEGGRNGPELILLSDGLFDRTADTESPQGVMAVVEKRRWSEDEFFANRKEFGGNALVLDRLTDPGNLGTVLRTADGAGFSGAILMKGCGDIYNPKVVRACAGTLFRLPVLFCATPAEALALLSRYGKKVYASALADSELYYKCDLKGNTALIIGNEGNGVCRELMEGAAGRLTIPMEGNQESLNAGVAAGILMYETVRQRNGGQ